MSEKESKIREARALAAAASEISWGHDCDFILKWELLADSAEFLMREVMKRTKKIKGSEDMREEYEEALRYVEKAKELLEKAKDLREDAGLRMEHKALERHWDAILCFYALRKEHGLVFDALPVSADELEGNIKRAAGYQRELETAITAKICDYCLRQASDQLAAAEAESKRR